MQAYAYEMAVGACDADGHTSARKRAVLDELATALGIEQADATTTLAQVEALVDAPLATTTVTTAEVAAKPDLDDLIVQRAVLAAALELLPQSLATMAIVPVQLKTVDDIGRDHGCSLDQASIRELLTIAGVGLAGQVLEGFARRLFGGALRGLGGKTIGRIGATAKGGRSARLGRGRSSRTRSSAAGRCSTATAATSSSAPRPRTSPI